MTSTSQMTIQRRMPGDDGLGTIEAELERAGVDLVQFVYDPKVLQWEADVWYGKDDVSATFHAEDFIELLSKIVTVGLERKT